MVTGCITWIEPRKVSALSPNPTRWVDADELGAG